MIDMSRAIQIMKEHFDNITPSEFMANVKKYCPELLKMENNEKPSHLEKNSRVIEIPYESYLEIEAIAQAHGITPTAVIENWIAQYIKKAVVALKEAKAA